MTNHKTINPDVHREQRGTVAVRDPGQAEEIIKAPVKQRNKLENYHVTL